MSEFDRVEVVWLDSESDNSWMPVAQALHEAEAEPEHRSCGYLVADADDYVLLALSLRPPTEDQRAMVADTLRIPRAAVVSLVRLRVRS